MSKPTHATDIRTDLGDLAPADLTQSGISESERDVSSEFVVDDACMPGDSQQAVTQSARRSHRRNLRPVCVYCKRMRDDRGVWRPAGSKGRDLPSLEITHFICPKCMAELRQQLRDSGLLPEDE